MNIFKQPIYTKEFFGAEYSFMVNVGDQKAASVEVFFNQDGILATAKYEGVTIKKPLPQRPLKPDYDWAVDLCQEVAEKVAVKLQTSEVMNKPL